jgi:hypothetical protein
VASKISQTFLRGQVEEGINNTNSAAEEAFTEVHNELETLKADMGANAASVVASEVGPCRLTL